MVCLFRLTEGVLGLGCIMFFGGRKKREKKSSIHCSIRAWPNARTIPRSSRSSNTRCFFFSLSLSFSSLHFILFFFLYTVMYCCGSEQISQCVWYLSDERQGAKWRDKRPLRQHWLFPADPLPVPGFTIVVRLFFPSLIHKRERELEKKVPRTQHI